MKNTLEARVALNIENVKKCLCGSCPVQAKSKCIKIKQEELKETLQKKHLDGADIPGMYCATGIATCDDVDTSQVCICASCPLFSDCQLYDSQPIGYYCRDGHAT